MKCPRCKSFNIKILYQNQCELHHSHCECQQCKYQFNHWLVLEDKIKKEFGPNYNLYSNN